jgi:hypothetical protein
MTRMLATALALAVVLTFSRMLGQRLLSVSHRPEGDARMAGRVQCIGTDGHRPGQKAGNRGAGNYCVGWFHVTANL